MSRLTWKSDVDLNAVFGLDQVIARFNYLAPTKERPYAYAGAAPPGVLERNTPVDQRSAFVRNGRPLVRHLSLDREGFQLVDHDSAVADFYDPAEIKGAYYPEAEQLVQRVAGAEWVLAFDHNVRHGARARRAALGAKEPAKRVHNDYTARSGPQRVRDLLPAEADRLLKRRVAVINVWRPIVGPLKDSPLAVCDARSIAPADLVPTELRYADRIGETYSVTYNDQHRWFYFPDMRPNEALLIKCYDSAEDGRARFAAHSAFDDPTAPPNAPPRQSIEVRTLAFFAA